MTEAVTEPETVVEEPAPAAPAGQGLHQPQRWVVAAGEAVAVVLLVVAAVWCWNRGVVPLEYPAEGREPLVSTRLHGNWLGTAAASLTLAVVLAIDAVRQVMLALRTRPEAAAQPGM
ncbi:hypothetical protein SAMN05216553_102404 [Lentzea fradiae]|uniref:Uncharacterized protein n=1 Tax=Lentzea fradiae TaxID=200378 RepID=A0A1G7MMI6_9PSEU|nr:hypothetical protein [Lentzea fradiae]SDF62894.1 hypothetical protein SAMN05216553_102404 [Lentzea fradiae]